jgi:hypothetical protein
VVVHQVLKEPNVALFQKIVNNEKTRFQIIFFEKLITEELLTKSPNVEQVYVILKVNQLNQWINPDKFAQLK